MSDSQRSFCPFCSMGCSLRIRASTGAAYVGAEGTSALEYDAEGRFNRGSLCSKGNMTLELLEHPRRLDVPRIRTGHRHTAASWDEALDFAAGRIQIIREAHGAASIGIVAGPYLTNEEAAGAIRLAEQIGTPHLDGGQPEDLTILGGLDQCGATPERVESVEAIEDMTAILVIGDLFTLAPCIAKAVLHARYDRRPNLLGVLGSTTNRTAWFGKPGLRCLPGRESAALALMLRLARDGGGGRDAPWSERAGRSLDPYDLSDVAAFAGLDVASLQWVVDSLRDQKRTGVLISAGFGETERPDLVAGLAALLAEATDSRFLPMMTGPNTVGVQHVLEAAGYPARAAYTLPEMVEATVTGDMKALLLFGCDPLASLPGRLPHEAADKLELLVASGPLPGETTARADVVLPSRTWGEVDGTVTNAFGAELPLEAVLPPPGRARSDGASIDALIERIRPGTGGHRDAASAGPSDGARPGKARSFFGELDLHFRLERREAGAHEVGTHLLLPIFQASQAGDGWLTRGLSWPRYEAAGPELVISAAHAEAIGAATGTRLRVRSSAAEAVLPARIAKDVPEDVVLAPPHFGSVRHLMRWHVDPALRDLDLKPTRVSVEALTEDDA